VTSQGGFSLAGDGGAGALPKLSAIALTHGTTGDPITTANPATVTVFLHESDGTTPIANAVVNFALSGSVGSLSQSSALTDPSGEATLTLSVGTTQGAGTLTATYTDASGNTVTSQVSFAVQITTSGVPSLTTPTLLDGSSNPVGTTANPITDTNPATVSVTLTNGGPLANKLINFSLTGAVGTLDPSVGTALTDGAGKATITLKAGSQEGAGTIKATYSDGSNTATSQADFTTNGSGTVTALTLGLGTFTAGSPATFSSSIDPPASPQSGSSYSVKVDVVDTSGPSLYTDAPVAVTFTSQCYQNGLATISPLTANSIGGSVQISYSPKNGCTQDTISASATANGSSLSAVTPSFSVTQAPANSISFISASPATIGVKGSSAAGVQESSILTFQVKDSTGAAVGAGTNVDFTVQTPAGGFTIAGATSGTTDSSGDVTVTVNSGTVPMVGTIKASLTGSPSIYGTGSVSVQQGVATEDRFAIAVETLNPAAGNHLGVTDQVTVRAADRYGNWVPNGTIVHFSTKLGDIGPSCTTTDGACSVTWTSQGPQSLNFDKDRTSRTCFTGDWERNGLPPTPTYLATCTTHDLYGVNVISAWTTGEESFDDANGNNQYDDTETFIDLPEEFQDFNLTGTYEGPDANYSGETYSDLNTNGSHDGPDTKYDGLSCAASAVNCVDGLIDVRTAATMVLSTDGIQMGVWGAPVAITLTDPSTSGWGSTVLGSATPMATDASTGSFYVVVADDNGNAPPVGTSISVTATAVTGAAVSPKLLGPSSCTVSNSLDPLVCQFTYVGGSSGNNFTITATSGGNASNTVSDTLTVP
jgi:hypothetical protein